jgi:ATP-dependent RNA helicase DDX1
LFDNILTPFVPHLAPVAAKPSGGKKQQHVPMALIIEPARELAQQTFENVKLFKKYLPAPKPKLVM